MYAEPEISARRDLPYHGALRVLKVMLGYEISVGERESEGRSLRVHVRLLADPGDSYFVSYRDPNLEKTLQIYEEAPEAISQFSADERTMTQYVIGAVSDLDVPMNPAAKGLYSLSAYMTGLTQEMLQRERDELLAAEPETIRSLAKQVKAFLEEELLCVVGSAGKNKGSTGKI